MIERGVKVKDSNIHFIRFNRSNPHAAIKELFAYWKKKSAIVSIDDDIKAIAAGIAVAGVLGAIVALLAGRK